MTLRQMHGAGQGEMSAYMAKARADLRKTQAELGAAALVGGGVLTTRSAVRLPMGRGRVGLLTGLALGLYGLMMSSNARAEGKADARTQVQALRLLRRTGDMQGTLPGGHMDINPTAPPGAHADATSMRVLAGTQGAPLTDRFPHLRDLNPPPAAAHAMRDNHLAAMHARLASPTPKTGPASAPAQAPHGEHHVWDDAARKAAALARHVNAAWSRHSSAPPPSSKPRPPATAQKRGGKKKVAAAGRQGGTGMIDVTRKGPDGKIQHYKRERSVREKK